MSNYILTEVKEKLKTVTRFSRFFAGPLLTVACIALNQALILAGAPIQVALLFLPVAWAGFGGGVRSALVSAAFVSIYSAWLDPANVQRVLIVPLTVFALAGLVGWRTRTWRGALDDARRHEATCVAALERAERNEAAARTLEALNGNVERVRGARESLLAILIEQSLTEEVRTEIRVVLHTLNSLELSTAGWVALKKLKAEMERGASDPLQK